MKQIIIKKGNPVLENVPKPVVSEGSILIKVVYSCISQGTELSGLKGREKYGFVDKIKSQKENVSKTYETLIKEGFAQTLNKIQDAIKGKGGKGREIGYSAAGIVKEVGSNINDIKMGDYVSCAGAGIANHAEYVVVPRNLVMKVSDELDLKFASTTTLGGIAMQGVRRGNFKIGEFVVVTGLGFLGQLTVQLLKASGCRVLALDIDERRCKLAEKHGAEFSLNPKNYEKIEAKIYKITNGFGADGVIFTAATNEPSVISSAFKMCKRKGKVILVGVAGNKIDRNDLYQKELDFLISTSYGPGRYDDNYELKGYDYPYAYVRWTENRNMEEYLRLLSTKKIVIDDLIEKIYPISEATNVYEELQTLPEKPIIALFEYPHNKEILENKIEIKPYLRKDKNIINVAIIGAGGFAQGMHLPNLKKIPDKYNIYAICDINPLNAKETAARFGANIATTNYDEILKDNNVDLVMICTHHNLHVDFSIRALKAGKAVFVEKPMATNENELNELVKVIQETKLPFMVGFNRRFSPFAKEIKKHINNRINPMMISYRMNAGYLSLNHWVHEDGGRIIGEGCHIIDLFNYLTDSEIISVSADKINPNTKAISSEDNVSITIKYNDGSIANLIYTALGTKEYPKENMIIYCDGVVYKMTDYLTLECFGSRTKIPSINLKKQDKGHIKELERLYETLIGKNESSPIELDDMIQTTKVTFLINKE